MAGRPLVVILWMALAASLGCDQREGADSHAVSVTPAAPSFLALPPTWITVSGRTTLSAPGETTQLRAQATFLDGTRKDLTDEVGWHTCGVGSIDSCATCPYKVVNVDPRTGVAEAVAYGRTNVVVVYPRGSSNGAPGSVRGWTPFRVVPDGMAILSGHVLVDGAGHEGVLLELQAESKTLKAITNAGGAFMFAPVTGEVTVRAWHEGVGEARRVLRVTYDEDISLELTPGLAAAGSYPR